MKILAFGEVMMRLTPPQYKLIQQTDNVDLSFTGTGVNILSSLAHFGYDTSMLTILPDNQVGRAAVSAIRSLGIKDEFVRYQGDHMGLYFLEMGFGNRPSEVTYLNRLASSFGESTLTDYDLAAAVANSEIIHICGIALMLSEGTRQAAFKLAELAHEAGKKVCFDFNYRPSLNKTNSHEWVKKQFDTILPFCDIVIGGIRDLTELMDLEIPAEIKEPIKKLEFVSQQFVEKYQLAYFAGTIRDKENSQPSIRGFITDRHEFIHSQSVDLQIYDRIGTGDAYAAGIITGMIEKWDKQKMVQFAISNAVLAHTTFGDSPLMRREQVEAFSQGNHGDVIR